MDRRTHLALLASALGAAALGGLPGPARAHHGWSSFDTDKPLYLKGRVKAARWRNPHVELELQPDPGLALPEGLARRELPAQSSQFDGQAVLARTQLPARRDETWTIELAPLTRMKAWDIAPIQEGETIELIGYTLTDQSEAVLRAEWLFRGGKAYGLRSSPA